MSRRMAVVLGVVFNAVGAWVVLVAAGVLPANTTAEAQAPGWVIAAVGLSFMFCGAAVIVGFAVAGGVGPNGDLAPGTPFAIRLLHNFFGLGIIGLLAAVASWIAFGAGERRFSGSISFPVTTRFFPVHASPGRVAFVVGAVLLWIIFAGYIFTAARRLLRSREG